MIEAMGSGGAVLAHDTPENREVGGDAVRYFDLRPLDAFLQGANLVFCRSRLRFGLPVRHVERVDLAGDAPDLIAAE